MAKVESPPLRGLAGWIPEKAMVDLVEYYYCPIHGLQYENFFDWPCGRFACSSAKYLGTEDKISKLEKFIYGLDDAKSK